MKQLIVVVIIWYIHVCVNEYYLFTRADNNKITVNFNDRRMSYSCDNTYLIYIIDIAIEEKPGKCTKPTCDLTAVGSENVKSDHCDEKNKCELEIEWTTPCFRDIQHSYYNVSYTWNATCDFEASQCGFKTSSEWKRVKGGAIPIGNNQSMADHTTGTIYGHFMAVNLDTNGKAKLETQTIGHIGFKCLSLWYFVLGSRSDVVVNIYTTKNIHRGYLSLTGDNNWHKEKLDIYIDHDDYISFVASSINNDNMDNVIIGIDDVSLSLHSCGVMNVKSCVSSGESCSVPECPIYFLNNLNINFHDIPRTIPSSQVCQGGTGQCTTNDDSTLCTSNFTNIINDNKCRQLKKKLRIEYLCIDADVTSSIDKTTHQPPDTTIATTLDTQMTSGTPHSGGISLSSESTSSTSVIGISLSSESTSSTSVIGIVVGVILSVLIVSAVLIVVFFKRSRYFEKKGNSIVVEKNNHSDYTGHQNVVFSPEVNVTTQTDYCEIRTSKHNDQYHDITDTFSPSINSTNDDEYSEIANVVNSTNNPNASANYQHQYISLDPNANGFNQSNPHTNLHNESRNNTNSNVKPSFTGGDDYAILDPDDLNESKNKTSKVLPLSENYVVLDPNETGFNRRENTDTVCNYELATPINPTETSEDPYDVSKDETYDTSSNSRHKEKDNNIYSHMVDNVYDTAGNQRKEKESDATYDHFFGQQSEDDYDISKPL